MQLSQKAAVSVRRSSADSKGLSRGLTHNNEGNSISVSAEENAGRILRVAADRNDCLLRWNDYTVSKGTVE